MLDRQTGSLARITLWMFGRSKFDCFASGGRSGHRTYPTRRSVPAGSGTVRLTKPLGRGALLCSAFLAVFAASEQLAVRPVLRGNPNPGGRYGERERTERPFPRYIEGHLLRGKEDPVGIAEDGQGGAVPEIEGRLREAPGRDRRSS